MNEAEKQAELRYRNWRCDRNAFTAGVEWERTREATDAEVEVAAKAAYDSMRSKLGFPTEFEDAPTPLANDYRAIAQAALKATRAMQE